MGENIKLKIVGLIILIVLFFISGCQDKIVENKQGNLQPLLIFGQADVEIKVLEIREKINSVNIDAKIINIEDYTTLVSKDILLDENDEIILYFSGVGSSDEWKTNLLSKDSLINLKVRCLDGRINSKDLFTKESCYWESNEEDIEII